MKFGIDFGTTNTAFSYIKNGVPTPLRFGEAQQPMDYVPSVMAVRSAPRDAMFFGQPAKNYIGQPNVRAYQNFKMLLGESNAAIQGHWGENALSPEHVTEKYIAHMLGTIKEEHKLLPKGVVVTIPEIWSRQNLHTKKEHLMNCFKRQGIHQVAFESEPVAAASYYLDSFKRKKKNAFNGYLLVCDCGGGTMDFCLVKVENTSNGKPRCTVLERAGNGMVGGHLGSAGVAFDQGIVELLFPGLKTENPQKFFKLVREFESQKIMLSSEVDELLSLFQASAEAAEGTPIFELSDQSVEAMHLVSVFEARIKVSIEQAMQDLLSRITELNKSDLNPKINIADPKQFRVLMVGGFSAFYLVQQSIKSAFGNVTDADLRFEEILTKPERALAIANGAALIANDLTEIVHTCPADIGLLAYAQTDNNNYEIQPFPVLRKGTKIDAYKNAIWLLDKSRKSELILHPIGTNANLPLYLEPVNGHRFEINVEGASLLSVFPDGLNSEPKVHIGFSLNEDMVFSIHVRDAINHKNVKITTLGSLLAQMPQGLIAVGA